MTAIEEVEKSQLKDLPDFGPGDQLRVQVKVIEGGRERLQAFQGTVLKRSGKGLGQRVTIRRVSHAVGVERGFLLHSPRVEKIEVLRRGRVRRAKLYYLRNRQGRGARIREKRRT
ncbi:MAG: 50S ribosomal protein L19 [Armatimonadetes bacterium]|nr:50S ribosomal protein L19 [Armatimonadota bacterium]NIM24742.1 50S ribosomal protein L19 [Armatimonadota bacterium]NIM68622.1 50S ribosomal protein L19 [Armatimonadota bacterium]NIM77139.1 50S ribosomal protein L19 [Armatimonadota bacterium]NIN06816.1 50S ribosomal protein L19 [Armatimonadota bacterium]